MFFDFIPNTLITLTILFPLYASHKALSAPPSSSPNQAHALFAPWLTYFVVLTLFNLVESYTPIIPSLPFYSFARLALHVYLLLPGPGQGSAYVYSSYIAPFLQQHEKQIEDMIQDVHNQVKSIPGVEFALSHIGEIWAYVQERVFGKQRHTRNYEAELRHAPPTANTYMASLLGRFIAPEAEGRNATTAGTGAGAMAGMLSAAISQASNLAASGGSKSGGTARGEPLIPDHVTGDTERLNYINDQRRRLRSLLSAFDKEEDTIHLASSADTQGGSRSSIGRNRSDYEFETIRQEDVRGEERPSNERRTSKGWTGWMFGKGEDGGSGEHGHGKSSGVDVGR